MDFQAWVAESPTATRAHALFGGYERQDIFVDALTNPVLGLVTGRRWWMPCRGDVRPGQMYRPTPGQASPCYQCYQYLQDQASDAARADVRRRTQRDLGTAEAVDATC